MKKINYAIIGYGSIGKTHALASFDANIRYDLPYQLRLAHVVTRRPTIINLENVNATTDLEAVLSDESLDFISICTPNDNHLEVVEKAIKYKKAIYCEKPLASTLEDAQKMTALIKESKIQNAVALMYRFLPSIALLKSEIEKGTIGQIIEFKITTYHDAYLDAAKKDVWRTKKSSGGGAMLDLGIHLVDLIHYVLGDIKTINYKSKIHFTERNQVDEIAKADIELESRISGTLEVSRIFTESTQTNQIVVFGENGSIKVDLTNPFEIEIFDYFKQVTQRIRTQNEPGDYFPSKRNSLGFFQDCHTSSLVNFSNQLVGIHQNKSATFEDAEKAQRIIEQLYQK